MIFPKVSPTFYLLLQHKQICCRLLLVVSDVLLHEEVDKLSSTIRILLQLITILKENSFSRALIFLLSLHTLSSKSLLSLMPLPMNFASKVYVGLKMCWPSSIAPLQVVFCGMLKTKFFMISHFSLRSQKRSLTTTQANLTNLSFLLLLMLLISILFHLTSSAPYRLLDPFLRHHLGTVFIYL